MKWADYWGLYPTQPPRRCKCGAVENPKLIDRKSISSNGKLVQCSKCAVDPEAIADVMAKMEGDWFFLDEILFVATAHFGIKASHTTLKNALRELWRDQRLKYSSSRKMFRLTEGGGSDAF